MGRAKAHLQGRSVKEMREVYRGQTKGEPERLVIEGLGGKNATGQEVFP